MIFRLSSLYFNTMKPETQMTKFINNGRDRYAEAAKYIADRAGKIPNIAVVLGSGLSDIVAVVKETVKIKYSEIPFFPQSTAPTHEGALYCGYIGDVPVFLFSGRTHCYEGYSMSDTAFYVGVMAELGIKILLLTNAAGAVNKNFAPGDIMLITDHIKLTAESPLTGQHNGLFGSRFPPMTEVYDKSLRQNIQDCADALKIDVKSGVYMYFAGPQYETPAEIRAAAVLGADAVGMSTVPEAVAACAAKIKVAGLSVITNMAAGIYGGSPSEAEVTASAKSAENKLIKLIESFIKTAK